MKQITKQIRNRYKKQTKTDTKHTNQPEPRNTNNLKNWLWVCIRPLKILKLLIIFR